MVNIHNTNLYIGSRIDINLTNDTDWAYAHVTKKSHQGRLGYFKALPSNHPNYLFLEENNHLYVNWVDAPQPRFYDFPTGQGIYNFMRVLDFIDKWIKDRKVLIHCDLGESRSPTTGLVYLAKRMNALPNTGYEDARKEFIKLYPNYNPNGIGLFVSENWNLIK